MDGDTKLCRKCDTIKPLDAFYLAKNGKASGDKLVRKGACKECQSRSAREWQAANRERATLNRWRSAIKINYGMSEQEWHELLQQQGGGCAICGETASIELSTGTVQRMSVDHCHNSGKIRGILCNTCNRAIGLLKDDARLLRRAADYLER